MSQAVTNPVSWSAMKGSSCKVNAAKVSGVGTVLSNAALYQTCSFFEINILKPGEPGDFCIGVTQKSKDKLELQLSQRNHSWALSSSNISCKEGDVIGVTFDQADVRSVLRFYLNGEELTGEKIAGTRGDVYPAVSVKGTAVLEANFDGTPFKHPVGGYDGIIFAQDMI